MNVIKTGQVNGAAARRYPGHLYKNAVPSLEFAFASTLPLSEREHVEVVDWELRERDEDYFRVFYIVLIPNKFTKDFHEAEICSYRAHHETVSMDGILKFNLRKLVLANLLRDTFGQVEEW